MLRNTRAPQVSVVVPAKNEAANLRHVLPLLEESYQVILVDGRSDDGTCEVARSILPGIIIVKQEGRGKGAADATVNAMGAVAKLPTARMMSGRERCIAAPNGAPDCVSAAEALCRKHGFTSGKSMDFTSAEECPVRTLLGQTQDCTTVTFISSAMCQ